MKLRNLRHYDVHVWPVSIDDPIYVDAGDTFEVPGADADEIATLARSYLDQPANWEPADDAAQEVLAQLQAAPALFGLLTGRLGAEAVEPAAQPDPAAEQPKRRRPRTTNSSQEA